MDAFHKLLDIARVLMGPDGCPWDKQQTLFTLQPYLLEEAHELIEAIDCQDPKKMKEELGDVIYTLIFIARLAEEKELFTLDEALLGVGEKMVRRHPHIFGQTKVEGAEDVMRNWEEIKKLEGRKNLFEGIPPTLPALSRAQKVVSKLVRKQVLASQKPLITEEEDLAKRLWDLVKEAEFAGLDAESVLRRLCMAYEKENTGD